MNKHEEILAKGNPDYTTLYDHLCQVRNATKKFAEYLNLDVTIAIFGAILHDIGKVSQIFQKRVLPNYVHTTNETPYRHEIASLFFISLFDVKIHPQLIEMILSHHKSIIKDMRERGLFDLKINYGVDEIFNLHSENFEIWSETAMDILECFGIERKKISLEDAKNNLINVIEYVNKHILGNYNYSTWKGLLMGGDHFASALQDKTDMLLKSTFTIPNLAYYHTRKSDLYPLSQKKSNSKKRHTIATACTGAGKTDFLLRRCTGRVFYTLPFTASINAMFGRIKNDLEKDNKDIDIRVLHSSSKIQEKRGVRELKLIQSHFGSSVKVLTPHQMANIVFGTLGYEATLLDLKGCDIILDEIHTYSDKIQGIVLKIIEMLHYNGCKIHIGTATLPNVLYKKILEILGEENVYQVKLTRKEMRLFDRHKIFKYGSLDEKLLGIIEKSLNNNGKVLVVKNRVADSQETYTILKNRFPTIPILVLHSRFKRGRRNELEGQLLEWNKKNEPCIVVSTQVVEVSLDISFNLMVTDCAPIDSLIQRFGRINRIRNMLSIGKYMPIYILAPPLTDKEAKPYDLEILNKTYEVLPNKKILREYTIQKLIDIVYSKINITSIDAVSIFENGKFDSLCMLQHQSKSVLLDELGITSANLILSTDVEKYKMGSSEQKIMLEIPVSYFTIQKLNLPQLNDYSHRPFIIDDDVYSDEIGLDVILLKIMNDNSIL